GPAARLLRRLRLPELRLAGALPELRPDAPLPPRRGPAALPPVRPRRPAAHRLPAVRLRGAGGPEGRGHPVGGVAAQAPGAGLPGLPLRLRQARGPEPP